MCKVIINYSEKQLEFKFNSDDEGIKLLKKCNNAITNNRCLVLQKPSATKSNNFISVNSQKIVDVSLLDLSPDITLEKVEQNTKSAVRAISIPKVR